MAGLTGIEDAPGQRPTAPSGGRFATAGRGELLDALFDTKAPNQHHRGQVHAMLSGTSVAPPQLDEFVMIDDAETRVPDLAGLGKGEDWLAR